MNIEKLDDELNYGEIFKNCTRKNGKVDWLKVAVYENLPVGFIDKYFFKLKNMQIETLRKLDRAIIKKYAKYINWYSLLRFQELDEEIIRENIETILVNKVFQLVLCYQKISIKFAADYKDLIKSKDIYINSFNKNKVMTEEEKKSVLKVI